MVMNRDELWEQLQSASPDSEYLTELENKLKAEMQKPLEEQNSDLIDELTATISVINGTDELIARSVHQGIRKVHNTLIKNKTRSIFKKSRVAVGISAVFLLAVNILSYSAYGMNVLTLTYTYVKGGVKIEFQKNDSGTSQGGICEDMRRICSENGLEDVMLPSYIPEGFYPSEGFGQVEDNEKYISILFLMKKQEEKIVFTIINYKSPDDVMPYGIPSDEHNIEEKEYHDTKVVISTEDHQYRAVFMKDIKQYGITTYGVDYSLAERIVDSIFN